MTKPEDLEYVNLEGPTEVRHATAALSGEFARHIQNCRSILSDLKIKHTAIREAVHVIGGMQESLKELDRLMQKDAFKHHLEHEKTFELKPKDVRELQAQAEPDKEATIHNEEALKNLQRNMAELRLHLGV
jgi:hypothetical protein